MVGLLCRALPKVGQNDIIKFEKFADILLFVLVGAQLYFRFFVKTSVIRFAAGGGSENAQSQNKPKQG